jgi:DNA repair exonuclease SbcCD nuclease subunit
MLLGHLGVQGALVGADYVMLSKKDVDLDMLSPSSFDACFFGHFHKHQKLCRNAWYIGATHQHNWGDSGDTRGFLDVTISKKQCSVTQVPTCSAPRFVKVRTEKDLKNVREADFVKVFRTSSNASVAARAREVVAKVEELEEAQQEDTSLPKELFDPLAMVKEWVKLHGEGDPDLLEAGTSILTKVLGDKS